MGGFVTSYAFGFMAGRRCYVQGSGLKAVGSPRVQSYERPAVSPMCCAGSTRWRTAAWGSILIHSIGKGSGISRARSGRPGRWRRFTGRRPRSPLPIAGSRRTGPAGRTISASGSTSSPCCRRRFGAIKWFRIKGRCSNIRPACVHCDTPTGDIPCRTST